MLFVTFHFTRGTTSGVGNTDVFANEITCIEDVREIEKVLCDGEHKLDSVVLLSWKRFDGQ